jgi:hypothetical protein
MTDQELNVSRSARGHRSASIELLSQPDSVPLLSDSYPQHRLLKLFSHSSHDKVAIDSLDLDLTLEGTAEFLWRRRLPDDAPFCQCVLSSLYDLLASLTWDTAKDVYPCVFLGMSGTQGRVLSEPKSFFDESHSLSDFLNTHLWVTLAHMRSLGYDVDSAIGSDLTTHGYLADDVRELAGQPVLSRLVFCETAMTASSRYVDMVHPDQIPSIYAHFLRTCGFGILTGLRAGLSPSGRIQVITTDLIIATLLISVDSLPDLASLIFDSGKSADSIIWLLLQADRGEVELENLQKSKLTPSLAIRSLP